MIDLASMSYGELVDSLRKDLQLDAATDLLSKSVGQTALAPVGRVARLDWALGGVTLGDGISIANGNGFFNVTTKGGLAGAQSSPSGIKATVRGNYLFTTVFQWDNDTSTVGDRGCGFATNGVNNTDWQITRRPSTGALWTRASQTYTLNAGDVVSPTVYQNTGGNLTISSIIFYMTGVWLSNAS